MAGPRQFIFNGSLKFLFLFSIQIVLNFKYLERIEEYFFNIKSTKKESGGLFCTKTKIKKIFSNFNF